MLMAKEGKKEEVGAIQKKTKKQIERGGLYYCTENRVVGHVANKTIVLCVARLTGCLEDA